MWRWCRRGVLARTGDRIRLEHVRVGGKLFTRPEWVQDFGHRLAQADARYFDREEAKRPEVPAKPAHRIVRPQKSNHQADLLAEVNRQLDEAGL
jgi:hypothetical protein